MKENSSTKTGKDIITPEIKSEIPLNAVKFKKSWTFWETYVSKTTDLSFENSNKLIFKWDDLITFFQFWNKYPGRDIKNILFDGNNLKYFFKEKYRINAMNIFQEGIKPMWEDEQNKGGKYFQLDYKIKNDEMDTFSELANVHWKKLALCTMGGSIPHADYINGIRFVDKTNFLRGKIIMFRIEIWVDKFLDVDKLNLLKDYMKKERKEFMIKMKNLNNINLLEKQIDNL